MAKRPLRPERPFSAQAGFRFAFQVGTEFTSGILVGLLMGYAIDQLFSTQPWGIVVMVLLGSAAGMLNIFRMLGLWGPSTTKKPPRPPGEKNDG